jgi:uncharacterized cupredoxin-like copper-binding protein
MMLAKHALVLAAALGLPMLGSPAQAHGSAGGPEWASFGSPGKAGAPARTITVTAGDMHFSRDAIEVHRGETIRFVVTNRGPSKHEFVIGDRAFHLNHIKEMEEMPDMPMDEANSVDLSPGQTKILLWQFNRPGEFLFGCDIPGHFQAGMVGKLHVR